MINDDPTATKTHLSNVDSYRAGLEENAGWFLENYNGDMTLVNQFHTQLQATSEVTNKVIEYLSTMSLTRKCPSWKEFWISLAIR